MSIAPDVEKFVLGPATNGIRMSPEEFDAIGEGDYDPDYRYELIDGVLIVNAIPLPAERGPNQELGRLLLNYRYDHPQGAALDNTLEEEHVRTARSRMRADRVIWTGLGRQPSRTQDMPTIIVEFVSSGRRSWQRDYIEKRDEYLALDIREYWIFDRFQRCLTVFRADGSEQHELTVDESGVYRTDLLPGFDLPIAQILTVADEWADD